MAANRAPVRAPHKLTGGLLLTAGATILLGIFAILGALSPVFTVAGVFLRGRSGSWGLAGWSGGWSTRSCCGWSASAAS
jgi:hypothetical protein